MNMSSEITIQVRLYEELNRVLPEKQRKSTVASEQDKRIILNSNPGLVMKLKPNRCFCLKASKPEEQLQEVLLRFQLC
jgi:uncharacterized protein with PIN domain